MDGVRKLSLKVRIAICIYKKSKNSKLRRFLEKRIAAWTGGFAYSLLIRKLYIQEHGLDIGYGHMGAVGCIPPCGGKKLK